MRCLAAAIVGIGLGLIAALAFEFGFKATAGATYRALVLEAAERGE